MRDLYNSDAQHYERLLILMRSRVGDKRRGTGVDKTSVCYPPVASTAFTASMEGKNGRSLVFEPPVGLHGGATNGDSGGWLYPCTFQIISFIQTSERRTRACVLKTP